MKKNLFARKLLPLVLCFGLVLSMYNGVVAYGEEIKADTNDEGTIKEVTTDNGTIEGAGVTSQPDADSEDDVVPPDNGTIEDDVTPPDNADDEEDDTTEADDATEDEDTTEADADDEEDDTTEADADTEEDDTSQADDDEEDDTTEADDDDEDDIMPLADGYTFAATGWRYANENNQVVYVPEMKSPTWVVFLDGQEMDFLDGLDPEDWPQTWLDDFMENEPVTWAYFREDDDRITREDWWQFTLDEWQPAEPFESESEYDGWVQYTYTTTVTGIIGADFDPTTDRLTIEGKDGSVFKLEILVPADPDAALPKQPRYGVTAWNFNGADGYLTDNLAYYDLKPSEKEGFNPAQPEAFATKLKDNPSYKTIKVYRAQNPDLPSIGDYGDWGDIDVTGWSYVEPSEGNEYSFENEYYYAYTYKAETAYQFYWNYDGEPTDFYICIAGEYKNPLDEADLNKHIISSQEPAALEINLFDYWVDSDDHSAEGEFGAFADRGINEGHHLKFRISTEWWLGNDRIGSWNTNKGLDETGGIVANKLGDDGYPKLQLDQLEPYKSEGLLPSDYSDVDNEEKLTESLAYLFDPDKKFDGNGRDSYVDVNGLLTLDDDGNYAFSARKNYAYYNTDQRDGGNFTLYDTWGIVADGESPNGQFFPFVNPLESAGFPNTAVFVGEKNGALVQASKRTQNNGFGFDSTAPGANHWIGMTMETDFVQPVSGRLNASTPMTFTFRGDDDVWVFIDDVLVIDISGIHSTIGAKIDFSTGEVIHFPVDGEGNDEERYEGARGTTTLRALYEAALGNEFNEEDFSGNTFATYTQHTLKMFYLERGGIDSNFALSYNLMQPQADRVRKVDEDGNPIEGVMFDIYTAYEQDDGTYAQGKYITSTTTDRTGHGEFLDNENIPISFADIAEEYHTNYFLLRETNTPAGYRANPDLVLTLNETTKTFTVVNKWQTGAYGSFTAYFTQRGTDGLETEDGEKISQEELLKGLVLVVPSLTPANSKIQPMYGSNTTGWDVVVSDEIGEAAAVVTAAILQMRSGDGVGDTRIPDYYLSWEQGDQRLKGTLNNLPGDPSRYAQNQGSEAVGKYLFLSEEALSHFDALGFNVNDYNNADDRYAALKAAINTEKGFEAAMSLINNPTEYGDDLVLLSADQFTRDYRSVIYVPNEQRRLQVRKTDGEGNPLPGAVFAIFDTAAHAWNYTPTADTLDGILAELATAQGNYTSSGLLSFGQTVILQGETDATLTFEENGDNDFNDGIAHIDWPSEQRVGDRYTDITDSVYWMREIYAPDGYAVNPYLIRIAGGDQAIYANATGYAFDEKTQKGVLLTGDEAKEDNIQVQSGLGKLMQTLTKYASSIYMERTLRDITITKQLQEDSSTDIIGTWIDDPDGPTFNLHFGVNNEDLTGQYGLHDEDYTNGLNPLITVDDGYVRVMPRQNLDIGVDEEHPDITVLGWKTYLTDDGTTTGKPIDLNALFGLMNTIIVEDPMIAPKLKIEKWEAVTGTTNNNTALTGAPQQDDTLEVASGDTVTYYFKISNNGVEVAEHVTFSDELPETDGLQLQFVSGSARKYNDELWKNGEASVIGTESNGVVTIKDSDGNDLGDLEPGESIYLSFDVKIPSENNGAEIVRTIIWINEAVAAFEPDKDALYWNIVDDPEVFFGPQKSNQVSIATGPTGGLTVIKTVTGDEGDKTKEFTFTVTLSGDGAENINGEYDGVDFNEGVGVFTLKHGESKDFENLPAGLTYTVTEGDNEGYNVGKTGDTGSIQADQTSMAAFVNEKKSDSDDEEVTELIVSKTVIGDEGDKTKEFTFTVTLSGDGAENINGEYDGVDFDKGVGVFTLKHGESRTFRNLPAGLTYTVVESGNEGYTVTKTGDNGSIQKDQISFAAFENKNPDGGGGTDPTPTPTPGPAPSPDPGTSPDSDPGTSPGSDPSTASGSQPISTLALDSDHPATGDFSNLGLWIILAAGSVAGLVATGLLYKKKKKD